MPPFVTFDRATNLLGFNLPRGSQAHVTVQFDGDTVQQVDIKKGPGLVKKWKSCPGLPDSVTAGQGQTLIDNTIGTTGVDCTIRPRFTTSSPCPGPVPGPGSNFTIGLETSFTMSPPPAPILKTSSWVFTVPNGDTTGIVIVVEDSTGGGGNRISRAVRKLAPMLKKAAKAIGDLQRFRTP